MRHQFRTLILQSLFIAGLLTVLGRITYVQIHDRFIGSLEKEDWQELSTITPVRGTIYDALGDRLAFSVPKYDMDINLPAIQALGRSRVQKLAQALANITHGSFATINQQLWRTNVPWLRFFPYMVHVNWQTEQAILKLFSKYSLSQAINPYRVYARVYPDGAFASHVIGFVDQTQTGAAGIELEYNHYLAGKAGMKSYTKDLFGYPIPYYQQKSVPAKNGDNVVLTLNPVIQQYAEQALKTIEQRFTPAHAAIIVSNPNTGGILAMAALPHFNPNTYWNYPAATLNTNWAISDPFEPGSTFKIVTLTGALATHSITLQHTYMSGVDYVNGVPIRDWNLWGWGRISYRMAMIYSSNTGFIHIGQAEGVHNLYHYIHLYGMDRPTGIDLPGEGSSILFPEQNLNPVDFATMTFGQGLAVTPIQQIAEVDAVANGGKLLQPYLVQKIITPAGKVLFDHHVKVVRQVAPPSIMHQVTKLMVQDVADNPYEVNSYIPGYNIAGKTGTAQVPNPNGGGYLPHMYNLSFIAFAPAYHPQLAIYVTVNEPHNTLQYGNSVSSPAARFVLKRALAYLQVKPHTKAGTLPNEYFLDPYVWNSLYQFNAPSSIQQQYISMPNLTNQSLANATTILNRDHLRVHIASPNGRVLWQWPAAGHLVTPSIPVSLVTTQNFSPHGTVVTPDFIGLSLKVVIDEARVLGLQIHAIGDGYASSQETPAFTKVASGSVIVVHFTP